MEKQRAGDDKDNTSVSKKHGSIQSRTANWKWDSGYMARSRESADGSIAMQGEDEVSRRSEDGIRSSAWMQFCLLTVFLRKMARSDVVSRGETEVKKGRKGGRNMTAVSVAAVGRRSNLEQENSLLRQHVLLIRSSSCSGQEPQPLSEILQNADRD
jgi:hypothetical protein